MNKKIMALLLAGSLIAFPVSLLSKEDKGAELLIETKSGQEFGGELIAVKERSLLLVDSDSRADVSVLFDDISTLRIVKKSKALAYGGIGLLAGAMAGAVIGAAWNDSNSWWSDTEVAAVSGGFAAIAGGLAGAGIGAIVGMDDVFEFDELNKWKLEELMENLRGMARVPDYN